MSQKPLELTGRDLTISDVQAVAYGTKKVKIATVCNKKLLDSRKIVETIGESNLTYGINTGFGPMANYVLSHKQVQELQKNLVRSHAVGLGDPLDDELVVAIMLVRLNTLLQGHSGVRKEVVALLAEFINKRIIPIIPEHGSVGASGDLVQLAHVALALIGEGRVRYDGVVFDTKKILQKHNLEALTLQSKEGLAIINGTSAMSGIGALVVYKAMQQLDFAIKTGAMTYELLHGYDDPISHALQGFRPHKGQVWVAKKMREYVKGSQYIEKRKALQRKVTTDRPDVEKINDKVQDVYSVRCIPQIYGPIYETIQQAINVIEIEINSVTDNPIVDIDHERLLHGGNFHGDYISLEMDKIKIALSRIALTVERHVNLFFNPNIQKDFPPFLNLAKPGLDLALQGMQFVVTSTAAEIQTLCFPNYVHSITTNADNQDIVSMGTNSALITNRVLHNLDSIFTIYLASLAQAVDVLGEKKELSLTAQDIHTQVRKKFKKISKDRDVSKELEELNIFVKTYSEI